MEINVHFLLHNSQFAVILLGMLLLCSVFDVSVLDTSNSYKLLYGFNRLINAHT